MKRSEINTSEHPKYHGYYIQLCPDTGIKETLEHSLNHLLTFTVGLTEEEANYRYEEGKWSIKELIIHLMDVESVFNYRALKLARADFSDWEEFDQDAYVAESETQSRTLESILQEYELQRAHTIAFYDNMSKEVLNRKKEFKSGNFSIRALPYFIAGHELHHTKVLMERYLGGVDN